MERIDRMRFLFFQILSIRAILLSCLVLCSLILQSRGIRCYARTSGQWYN
jgi:hypothetical protein